MPPIVVRSASVLALALLCNTAHADTYCVATANELRNAMQAAANSPLPDEIRIRSGIYGAPTVPGNDAQYDVTLADDNYLDISGGWTDAGCTQQSQEAGLTLLDGLGQRRIFDIGISGSSGAAAVWIRNLAMRRGFTTGIGGCLRFQGYSGIGASLVVERVRFSECAAGQRGGAMVSTIQDGQTRVLGSLFYLNRSPMDGGAYLYTSVGNVFFLSNTVVQNEATASGSNPTGGITVGTSSSWLGSVANNLFFENINGQGLSDLAVLGPMTVLRNNRLDARSGAPLAESGTTDAPPQFVAANDFRLQSTSALRNGGYADPEGGYPTVDLIGEPRPQGDAVDIGAFEFPEQDVIFDDDFELN